MSDLKEEEERHTRSELSLARAAHSMATSPSLYKKLEIQSKSGFGVYGKYLLNPSRVPRRTWARADKLTQYSEACGSLGEGVTSSPLGEAGASVRWSFTWRELMGEEDRWTNSVDFGVDRVY